MQFYILAAGLLLCSLVFAALQEKVFRIEGFTYGGWMTFLTYVTYSVCGLWEWLLIEGGGRHGKKKDFAVVALTATLGYYLTNWSLQYLSYATRVVFKSSKVLPVMAFGAVIQRQHYTSAQYSAGALLVAGISTFTMGDREGSAAFSAAGVVLISLASMFDAVSANLEEARFFRVEQPCSQAEVVACMCGCAAVYSFVALLMTGELWPAVQHSMVHYKAE
ncbi:hypothetical protein WJX72_008311 [[Myrmecia] bisecta]|uniref:Uncharacterized protein n=1 Tax=[Myrmecia] bisecta TaxID=41462 RepID=A0AAW1Q8D0_9CHLO